MTQEQNPLDRKDLKIQALLEKVSSLTTQYENQAADLRVELTIVSEQLREIQLEQESLVQEDSTGEVSVLEDEDKTSDSREEN